MTITVQIKVNDGIVLASDSATTITTGNGNITNVYDNANKLFNLVKTLPIGAGTWGGGSFGRSSISTLAKDYRALVTATFDRGGYTIEGVTRGFADFLYTEHWKPAYSGTQSKPYTGLVVAGYSAGASDAEIWQIHFGIEDEPVIERKDEPNEIALVWNGQTDAISRLVKGCAAELPQILDLSGIDGEKIAEIMQRVNALEQPLIIPPMPIQDAIDLSAFLVDLTARYVRFIPGAPVVGGPIEIAAITKHEGFKWIKRKHYFTTELNQPT